VVLPTTRSPRKSQETVKALRQYARKSAEKSQTLRSRVGSSYNPSDTTRRIHIVSVQLDLCDLTTIKKAADQLINGTFSSVSEDNHFESLVDVTIPRLDSLIFNAGIGGWTGLNWPMFVHNVFTAGILQAFTFPTFKAGQAGLTVNPLRKVDEKAPKLGEVFCANVFGHYLFAHEILPLISRPPSSTLPPGRIIWESSIEPTWKDFSLSDFQGIETNAAYESSKRLTDVLVLTSNLSSVKPFSTPYLTVEGTETLTPPKIYLCHPGVVVTSLFPLNAFLFFWYRIAMYLARFIGSPWHTVSTYLGAHAMVWLALAHQEGLNSMKAERVKWGSSTDRSGKVGQKVTEVEGWGWEGKVEDRKALEQDTPAWISRKLSGRKSGAVDLTEESLVEFEMLGRSCWREMERLREEWETRMKTAGV
jgi:3-keto steroid reductase